MSDEQSNPDEQNGGQSQEVVPPAPVQNTPEESSEDVDATPAAPVEQAPGEVRRVGGKDYNYSEESGHRAV